MAFPEEREPPAFAVVSSPSAERHDDAAGPLLRSTAAVRPVTRDAGDGFADGQRYRVGKPFRNFASGRRRIPIQKVRPPRRVALRQDRSWPRSEHVEVDDAPQFDSMNWPRIPRSPFSAVGFVMNTTLRVFGTIFILLFIVSTGYSNDDLTPLLRRLPATANTVVVINVKAIRKLSGDKPDAARSQIIAGAIRFRLQSTWSSLPPTSNPALWTPVRPSACSN